MKTVLNVGSGKTPLSEVAHSKGEWEEFRMDADSKTNPDLVCKAQDMPKDWDNKFDAIWCSHVLEHIPDHETVKTLGEFLRVLKPSGFVSVYVPNLRFAAMKIVEGDPDDTFSLGEGCSVSALDMVYGQGGAIKNGETFMAHQTGFTRERLERKARQAGFWCFVVKDTGYNLLLEARKEL